MSGDPNLNNARRDRLDDSAWGCGWAWLWFWLFIIVICFSGWGWAGWRGGWGGPWGWWGPRENPNVAQNGRVEPDNRERSPQVTSPRTVTVPAPDPFLGMNVTVHNGKVDQVFTPQVFTVVPSEGGKPLLVIEKGKLPAVKKGETVQVTGKVEKFNTTQLHKETGVDLTRVPESDFKDNPAMVASTVSTRTPTE
jgi:hypothetical protein